MPDWRHHGEGEHDKRDMAMPAMPGAGLVMVESQFILGPPAAANGWRSQSPERTSMPLPVPDPIIAGARSRNPGARSNDERQIAVCSATRNALSSWPGG